MARKKTPNDDRLETRLPKKMKEDYLEICDRLSIPPSVDIRQHIANVVDKNRHLIESGEGK